MKLPPIPKSLQRMAPLLEEFSAPCVAFSVTPTEKSLPGQSKLGGHPDLPGSFNWPANKGRPLDYLLQIDLADVAPHEGAAALPSAGLLTFFYDLEEQPWGFDPKDLGGFKVIYTPPGTALRPHPIPNAECALTPCEIATRPGVTLPQSGSRAYEELESRIRFEDEEFDEYSEYAQGLTRAGELGSSGDHRLLGHSANVQGDMQLEAQLVTNGLYCGDPSGYNDPRAAELSAGADDWMLLLQLDSDDTGEFMWGDCGMLYYWIRRQDLAERNFDRVWMTLQCC